MTATIAFALASTLCFAMGLVLTQAGLLRGITPAAGAAISIPSSAVLLVAVSPILLDAGRLSWPAVAIFAAIGVFYPATATLLTFEANRRLGPVMTGTLGNLAPIFAVTFAVLVLGEPLAPAQIAGLAVILVGVMILTTPQGSRLPNWRSPILLLPLAAAAIRGLVQPAAKLGFEHWPNPYAAALVGYIVSASIVLVVARARTGRWHTDAPWRARLVFVGVGLSNAAALLLLYSALSTGPVTLVSPLVATYPLATIVLGALILGRFDGGVRLVFAVALTVLGVGLLIVG